MKGGGGRYGKPLNLQTNFQAEFPYSKFVIVLQHILHSPKLWKQLYG